MPSAENGPQIGDKYRIPWRDYAEVTIVARPYEGAGVEFTYDDTGELSYIEINSWMNWIGDRKERINQAATQ